MLDVGQAGFVFSKPVDQDVEDGSASVRQGLEPVMIPPAVVGLAMLPGQRLPSKVGQHLPGRALLARARS